MKHYYIRKTPKGKFWGDAMEYKADLRDPKIGKHTEYQVEYLKRLKELGWTIVKVTLMEIK